jgi:hypothetical protein
VWFKLKPSKIFTAILSIAYLAAIASVWLAGISSIIKILLFLLVITSFVQNVRQDILKPKIFSILTKNRFLLVDEQGLEIIAKLKFKISTKTFIAIGLEVARKKLVIIVFKDSLPANIYRLLSGKLNQLHADIGK